MKTKLGFDSARRAEVDAEHRICHGDECNYLEETLRGDLEWGKKMINSSILTILSLL